MRSRRRRRGGGGGGERENAVSFNKLPLRLILKQSPRLNATSPFLTRLPPLHPSDSFARAKRQRRQFSVGRPSSLRPRRRPRLYSVPLSTLFFEEFRWPAALQAIYAPNEPIFCCFPQFCQFPNSHLSCQRARPPARLLLVASALRQRAAVDFN